MSRKFNGVTNTKELRTVLGNIIVNMLVDHSEDDLDSFRTGLVLPENSGRTNLNFKGMHPDDFQRVLEGTAGLPKLILVLDALGYELSIAPKE